MFDDQPSLLHGPILSGSVHYMCTCTHCSMDGHRLFIVSNKLPMVFLCVCVRACVRAYVCVHAYVQCVCVCVFVCIAKLYPLELVVILTPRD